jgi:primosomal protein N'
MARREPHRAGRRAETRFRCRRCRLPYVMAGVYRRRTVRCHYCGDVLQVTQVIRRRVRRR